MPIFPIQFRLHEYGIYRRLDCSSEMFGVFREAVSHKLTMNGAACCLGDGGGLGLAPNLFCQACSISSSSVCSSS